jgi:hypothetical protein
MCVRKYEYTPDGQGAVMTNKQQRRMQRYAAAFAAACQSASQKSCAGNEESASGSPP